MSALRKHCTRDIRVMANLRYPLRSSVRSLYHRLEPLKPAATRSSSALGSRPQCGAEILLLALYLKEARFDRLRDEVATTGLLVDEQAQAPARIEDQHWP
jgi:hypothetical protein